MGMKLLMISYSSEEQFVWYSLRTVLLRQIRADDKTTALRARYRE